MAEEIRGLVHRFIKYIWYLNQHFSPYFSKNGFPHIFDQSGKPSIACAATLPWLRKTQKMPFTAKVENGALFRKTSGKRDFGGGFTRGFQGG